jgi:nucleotide-binding universal stress UspA family protein
MDEAMTTPDATQPRKILCPIDLSDFSASVLAHAVALARWYRAEVTALHVFSAWLPPAGFGTDVTWMAQVAEAKEAVAEELRALVEAFASQGAALELTHVEGNAAAEIIRRAQESGIDLIVMGTHGRSGFDRLALGSVAEKVLRKAPCPVLTLPPGAARTAREVQFQRILCPVDFSPTSEHALDVALSLARKSGGAVTALHVVRAIDGEQELQGPEYIAELRRRQCETAEGSLHEVTASRAAGASIEHLVVLGMPHREIVKVASDRRADVIVMGVRGRGAFDLTIFGSTTNQVVRRATCPVMTIRMPSEQA